MIKKQALLLPIFCLLTTLLFAQTASGPTVPVAQEPHHHAVIENEYVRVYKLEMGPKEATLMHRHDADYLGVMFGDTTFSNERLGSKPTTVLWKDGEVRLTKGGFSHLVRNEGTSPMRNATIELLRAGDSDEVKAGENVANPFPEKYSVAGVARKGFSTFSTTLPVGAALEVKAVQSPVLILAVGDVDVRGDAQGMGPHEVHMKSGDALWVPQAPTHTITNIGTTPARWVVVAFKN